MATTEETLTEKLAKLIRDNIQKLHRLLENVISNKGLQFATELTKKLNKMLEIEMKLSIFFHSQTDG